MKDLADTKCHPTAAKEVARDSCPPRMVLAKTVDKTKLTPVRHGWLGSTKPKSLTSNISICLVGAQS